MAVDTRVGRWVRREDGEQKVRGHVQYAGDLQFSRLVHVRLVLSPYAHARILNVDADAALSLRGVVGVFTGDDLPLVVPTELTRSRDPLARGRTYFEGHPVAAVVAESEAIAEDAASLVIVEYEELEVAADAELVLGDERELVHDKETLGIREDAGAHTSVGGHTEHLHRPANATQAERYSRGDVDAGFRDADAVVEHVYRTSWVHQAYLETQCSVAVPDGSGGITIYASTQGAFFTRSDVAKALGIPQHKVNVVTMEVGGAFGAKYALLDPLVAALAWKLERPVRLVLTRNEDFLAGTPAPGTVMRVKTGAKRDGTLTALEATVIVDTGAYPGGTSGIVSLLLGGTYRFPNLAIDAYDVLTNKPGCGAYRAPGAPQACFAIEAQIDELARELELDPMEFRLQNVVVEGDPMPSGSSWPRIGGREVLETLREHPSWKNRHSLGPNEGVGIALGGWPGGTQPASAACRLNGDGTLSVIVGSADISGTKTGMALLAADAFGVEPEAIQMVTADTSTAPFAGASGGSKITYTVGAAVLKAAAEARKQVLEIAADHLEASQDDLEIVDGQVQVRGVPDRGVDLTQIAALSTAFGGKYEPVFGHGRVAPAVTAPGFAAHLAKVRVDPETGSVTVLEYVAVQDVGRAINPAGIEDQVHGGVAQGIGWALYERMVYDEGGRLRTATFADYAMPTTMEIPDITSILVEVPSPEGPLGGRGVGEPPVVPGAGAIGNAIRDAAGMRLTELPMTEEVLLAAARQPVSV
ncbi:MAG: xanthine dehydrogenase family protein molybdopterin-binding subunit [Chloroflexota bacterium]